MRHKLSLGSWQILAESERTPLDDLRSGFQDVRFSVIKGGPFDVEVMDVRKLKGGRYVGGVRLGRSSRPVGLAEFNAMTVLPSPIHDRLSFMTLTVPGADGRMRRPSLHNMALSCSEQIVSYFCAVPELILGTRSEFFGSRGGRSKDHIALFPSDSALAPAGVWTIMRLIVRDKRFVP
jgi:hypothetical protein